MTAASTIYINSPNHNSGSGSMPYFARALVELYRAHGYDVVLCAARPSADAARCVSLPRWLRTRVNRVNMILLYGAVLLDIARRRTRRFAIVNISQEFIIPLFLRKSLVIVHDTIQMTYPRSRGIKALLAINWALARRSGWRVSVSRATQADLAAMGITSEVIYVPFDRSALQRYRATAATLGKTVDAIWCGTLARHKDFDTFVALARAKSGHRFCAILPAADAAAVAGFRPSNLELRHSLSDKAFFAALQAARVLVSTSLKEGYGMPAMEALMLGTPVLLSDIAVYREIYGAVATFFAPGDANDLQERFDAMLANVHPSSGGGDVLAAQGRLESYLAGIPRLLAA